MASPDQTASEALCQWFPGDDDREQGSLGLVSRVGEHQLPGSREDHGCHEDLSVPVCPSHLCALSSPWDREDPAVDVGPSAAVQGDHDSGQGRIDQMQTGLEMGRRV